MEPTNPLSKLILLISVIYIGPGAEIGAFDVHVSINLALVLISLPALWAYPARKVTGMI